MIGLPDQIPLIRYADGDLASFEKPWLIQSLCRAAQRAGYDKWWLADHVARSVESYLRDDFQGSVVPIEGLRDAVASVLGVIGYSDIADQFEPMPPPVRVSLESIALEADAGYELAFFNILRSRIRGIIDSPSIHVELFDLHPCVKRLRSAKIWRRDCSGLRSEIVRFIRAEIDASSRADELQIQLS